MSLPSIWPSTKNSTFLIEPGSVSDAVAVMVMFAAAGKMAPLVGYVMLTVGKGLVELTVKTVIADSLTPPRLSVALAVMA